jgi:hypothetical protein
VRQCATPPPAECGAPLTAAVPAASQQPQRPIHSQQHQAPAPHPRIHTSQLVLAQHACIRGLEAQHWRVLRPVLHSSDAHQLPAAGHSRTCSVTAPARHSTNSIAPAPLPAAITACSRQPQHPAQPQQHHAHAPHPRTPAGQSVLASQHACI